MIQPSFWDFVARESSDLVRMGVARRQVVDRRFAMTGHLRPISWPWIKTFGGWGGVLDVDELATRADVGRQVVRDYAKARGLIHATRSRRRSHAELAIELWCDRGRAPQESCARFGVYPGERRILCAAAQQLVNQTEGGIAAISNWTLRLLDQEFDQLGVTLKPPAAFLRPDLKASGPGCEPEHQFRSEGA